MRCSWSRPKAGTAALLTVPLMLTGAALGARAAAESRPARVPLPGSVPAWTAQAADQGVASGSSTVTARVYLAGRDPGGLAAFARSVSDPASPDYGHFLTAAQVEERFGPTGAQVSAVRDWLDSSGFRVLSGNAHYLTVGGGAAAVQRAFATPLHAYRRGGHVYTAPTAAVTVPAAVASAVLAVTGLDTAPHQVQHGALRRDVLPAPDAAFANSGPFSAYFGANPATGLPTAYGKAQPYVVQGFTGTQLRHAYGADVSKLTGSGVTMAVVDAYDSPTIGSDSAAYAAAHGDRAYRPGQLTRVDPGVFTDTVAPSDMFPDGCGAAGWYGEQSLDIESAHAVAPDANIVYVGAASCQDQDLVDALNRIVDGQLAEIVSNSWSGLESQSDAGSDAVYDQLFMRGAAEGIGFYFSSGDYGDELAKTGTKQVNTPSALPWVTAVGGTSLALAKNGDYRFETGWGTDQVALSTNGRTWGRLPGVFTAGGGGGTSGRVAEPTYQLKVVPDALAKAGGGRHRVVPDVAAVADSGTGFLIGLTQTWPDGSVRYGEFREGGTSLACPVFAAIQALAEEANGKPLGFANPEIYQRYGSPDFHDVTDHPLGATTQLAQVRTDFHDGVDATNGLDTTLRTMGRDSSLHATAGFDDVTGVGSPAPGYLRSFQHSSPQGGAAAAGTR